MNMRGYSAARIAELEREVADLRVDREMRKVAEDELADISKLFPVSEESGVLEAVQSVVADNVTLSRQLAEARERAGDRLIRLCKAGDQIDSLRAQLAASEKDRQWQPIETAPKDETEILVMRHGEITHVKWSEFHKTWIAVERINFVDHATHWMPLPQPPTLEAR